MIKTLLLTIAVLLSTPVLQADAASIDPDRVDVLDADTIRIDRAQPDVRLVPFNAPETRRAECAEERELGDRATLRLREIVRAGSLDLEIVRCACRAGTEGTTACNHGRRCGVLKSKGQNVGDMLILQGLAAPYHCGDTKCPKLPRPWCPAE